MSPIVSGVGIVPRTQPYAPLTAERHTLRRVQRLSAFELRKCSSDVTRSKETSQLPNVLDVLSANYRGHQMKAFRYAAMVAAVMLAVTTSPASACAGGGWRILHLEWLCCWIWGNDRKGCKQPDPGKSP